MSKDLIGKRFGRLTVLTQKRKNHRVYYFCRCVCGKKVSVRKDNLESGHTQSCGCFHRESLKASLKAALRFRERNSYNYKHGRSRTREYISWQRMKQRCYDRNASNYERYGGRGIQICKRWLNSFSNFYEDMGARPKGKTLDRIKNTGNYTPRNCRWATLGQQIRNRRKHLT